MHLPFLCKSFELHFQFNDGRKTWTFPSSFGPIFYRVDCIWGKKRALAGFYQTRVSVHRGNLAFGHRQIQHERKFFFFPLSFIL